MAGKWKVIAQKDFFDSSNRKIILRKGEFIIVERTSWLAGGLSGDELKEAFQKRLGDIPYDLKNSSFINPYDRRYFDIKEI